MQRKKILSTVVLAFTAMATSAALSEPALAAVAPSVAVQPSGFPPLTADAQPSGFLTAQPTGLSEDASRTEVIVKPGHVAPELDTSIVKPGH